MITIIDEVSNLDKDIFDRLLNRARTTPAKFTNVYAGFIRSYTLCEYIPLSTGERLKLYNKNREMKVYLSTAMCEFFLNESKIPNYQHIVTQEKIYVNSYNRT